MKKVFKVALSLLLLVSLSSCGTDIDAGSEGFMYYPYDGGVKGDIIYKEGFQFHNPWNDLIVYDIREKSKEYQSEVLDKNGLEVTITVSANYSVQKGSSAKVHLKYGEGYESVLIDKIARGAIKDVVGKYGAEELYSSKREALETEIETSIREALEPNHVDLAFIEVIDVDLPRAISQAIENKEAQEQANLLSAKKEQGEINLASAKRAKADGDAYKIQKIAQAEAEAIMLKQKALKQSPQYVDLVKAQRWNGVLPTFQGGGSNASFLVDIRDKK